MIKGSIQQSDIVTVNIYATHKETPKYIKEILTNIKGEINIIIVGEFNTPLTSIDRKSIKEMGLN